MFSHQNFRGKQMGFVKDDIVKLQNRLEWGLGKVLEDSSGDIVRIYFLEAGEKKLNLNYAKLEKVVGEEANHPKLLNLKTSKARSSSTGKTAKSKSNLNFSSMVEIFLQKFPDGFDDSNFYKDERGYKVTVHQKFQSLLSEADFSLLFVENKYDIICQHALETVTAMNKEKEFISRFEVSSLNSGLKPEANKKLFGESLYSLLYGEGTLESRFKSWCDCLSEINAAKWPIATFFGFIAFPKEQMFLKPDVTKKVANACDFELSYTIEPNWLTYKKLLDFSNFLFKQLAELSPKDMIDIQSFIWSVIKLDEGKY
jgi:hypothetical protein